MPIEPLMEQVYRNRHVLKVSPSKTELSGAATPSSHRTPLLADQLQRWGPPTSTCPKTIVIDPGPCIRAFGQMHLGISALTPSHQAAARQLLFTAPHLVRCAHFDRASSLAGLTGIRSPATDCTPIVTWGSLRVRALRALLTRVRVSESSAGRTR